MFVIGSSYATLNRSLHAHVALQNPCSFKYTVSTVPIYGALRVGSRVEMMATLLFSYTTTSVCNASESPAPWSVSAALESIWRAALQLQSNSCSDSCS